MKRNGKISFSFLIVYTLFGTLMVHSNALGFLSFQETLVAVRFDSLPTGSDGTPLMNPVKGDWLVEAGSYVERSGEYDCISLFPVFVAGSVKISAVFSIQGGMPGAGLVFSSHRAENASFCHMVRLDGTERIIAGYFEDGEFIPQTILRGSFVLSGWDTLTVIVQEKEQQYTIFLNGRSVSDPLPLRFPAGYAGLQSSGGRTAFSRFCVTRDNPGAADRLYWPRSFTFRGGDTVEVYSSAENTLYRYALDGSFLSRVEVKELLPWLHHRIDRILAVPEGIVLLTEPYPYLFLVSSTGKFLQRYGSRSGKKSFLDIERIKPGGRFLVLQAHPYRLILLDSAFREVASHSLAGKGKPSALASWGNTVTVLDRENAEVFLIEISRDRLIPKGSIRLPYADYRDICFDGEFFYCSARNGIIKVTKQGAVVQKFSGEMLPSFWPTQIELAGGKLWVLNYTGGSILVLDTALVQTEPEMRLENGKRFVLRWKSAEPALGELVLWTGSGKRVVKKEEKKAGRMHRISVRLPGGGSGNHFYLSYAPVTQAIGLKRLWSKRFTIQAPGPEGKMAVLRIPTLAVLFTRVVPDSLRPSDAPGMTTWHIRKVREELEEAARFLFIHSHCRLSLDLTFLPVEKPFREHDLFGREWYYPPRIAHLDSLLEAMGLRADHFPIIVLIAAVQTVDTESGEWRFVGKGGAFTNGISANGRFGLSWWKMPPFGHPSGNNWLFVHEVNHQIDELFLLRGYPEYWFNHFAPKLCNVGPFGEHFDGNAYLMQRVPVEWWTDLGVGRIEWVNDRDGDGIPDEDPSLPYDESRFGSSPKMADTDGDGLNDGQELLRSLWVHHGQGESWMIPIWPAPDRTDTDGDGKGDAEDLNPLVAIPDTIYQAEVRIDGVLEKGEWPWFVPVHVENKNAAFGLAWDGIGLAVAFHLSDSLEAKIMIDGRRDGWFLGRDNWQILVSSAGNSPGVSARLFDASSFTEWPRWNSEAAKKLCIETAALPQKNMNFVELRIPTWPFYGLDFVEGQVVAVSVSFRKTVSKKPSRFYSLGEPNRFLFFLLGKKGGK
jgi:hypothetical protein